MEAPIRLTAILLILGGLVFMVGAGFWRYYFQQPLVQTLPVIVERRKRWMWIHGWMLPGVILTAVAFFSLRETMASTNGSYWYTLAAVLFQIGAAPGICWLTFRITVMDEAAAAYIRTRVMPESFKWLHQWSSALYAVHMVLSFLASLVLGLAVLSGGILPSWFGWVAVVFGGGGCLGFVLMRGGPFSPPILAHAIPFTAGVLLLLAR